MHWLQPAAESCVTHCSASSSISASARPRGSLLNGGLGYSIEWCCFHLCLTWFPGGVQVDHIVAQYLLQQRYVTQNASRTESEVMLSAGPWIYTQALIAWIQDQGQDPLQVATKAPSMVGDVAIMGQQVSAFLSVQESCTWLICLKHTHGNIALLPTASSQVLVLAIKVQPVHSGPLVSDDTAAGPAAQLPAHDECLLTDTRMNCALHAGLWIWPQGPES